MNWMTDLDKTAAVRQAGSVEAKRKGVSNLKALQPQLRRLYEFLRSLAEQFNVVNPTIVHDYDILDYRGLRGLRQTRYVAKVHTQH